MTDMIKVNVVQRERPGLKCLWLMRTYPKPPLGGAYFYSSSLLDGMKEQASRVDVVCFVGDEGKGNLAAEPIDSVIHWHAIPTPRRNRVFALATALPAEAYRFVSSKYRKKVDQLLCDTKYDIIFIDHIGAAWILEGLLRNLRGVKNRPKLVYVSHNFEGRVKREVAMFSRRSLMRRVYSLIDAENAVDLEHRLLQNCDGVSSITQDDVEAHCAVSSTVIPGLLPPVYNFQRVNARVISEATPRRVVILGTVEWQAKVESFLNFIRVAEDRFKANGIELDVVGQVVPEVAREIDRRPWIKRYGFLPDPNEACLRARLGLMIDQVGGGFKTKVLNYFFSRTPLVGFSGQLQGLAEFVPGEDYLAARSMDDLVDLILRYIDDFEWLNRAQQSAYDRATLAFSQATLSRQLSVFLARLVSSKPAETLSFERRLHVRMLIHLMDHPFAVRSNIFRKSVAYFLQIPRTLDRLGSRAQDFQSMPPIVVNSIPKCGTHLLMQIAKAVPGVRYYGSFLAQFPTLTLWERRQRAVDFHISRIVPGEVLGAHLHYTVETEAKLRAINALILFIYRDPRDVVLSEGEYLADSNHWHAMHIRFKNLDREGRIRLAIEGADPKRFPDIRQRMLPYAGWVKSSYAVHISYEELFGPKRKAALLRIAERLATLKPGTVVDETLLTRLEAAIVPERSHTFRSGGVSKWKTNMPLDSIALFDSVARDLPDAFGYQPTMSGAVPN